MTLSVDHTAHTLAAPGANLYYEVRGAGPLVLVIGSPMASAEFAPLADALAADHTVVTYDPRGIAGSSIEDPEQDSTPELRADDIAALLDAVGAEPADVFGSSGGAVTGLAPGSSGEVSRMPWRVQPLTRLAVSTSAAGRSMTLAADRTITLILVGWHAK